MFVDLKACVLRVLSYDDIEVRPCVGWGAGYDGVLEKLVVDFGKHAPPAGRKEESCSA